MKKCSLLFLLMLAILGPSLLAETPPTDIPVVFAQNANWNSSLDISSAIPDEYGFTVDVDPTNCRIGPAPTYVMKSGQVERFTDFGKWQCASIPFGITYVHIKRGWVNLYTSAVYTDQSTGWKSRVDIPDLWGHEIPIQVPNSGPVGSGVDGLAIIERVANGYDGQSTYLLLATKDPTKTAYVTISVYDSENKLVGTEFPLVERSMFYQLQTKVRIGRAEVRTGIRARELPASPASSAVYVVAFEGFSAGGSPRVEVPRVLHEYF